MPSQSITLVIPTHNEEEYIGPCLDAVSKQTIKFDHVIVVDNNSTDKTIEICRKYSFVSIIFEKKQGMIYARNAGFAQAKDAIVARCDADTQLSPTWVAELKKSFTDPSVVAVSGPITFYDKFTNPMWGTIHTLIFFTFGRMVRGHHMLFGSHMALRKDTLDAIFPKLSLDGNKVHEDVDIAIQIAGKGKIFFNKDLKAQISARRIYKTPLSLFWYVGVYLKMLFLP